MYVVMNIFRGLLQSNFCPHINNERERRKMCLSLLSFLHAVLAKTWEHFTKNLSDICDLSYRTFTLTPKRGKEKKSQERAIA